MGFCKQWMKHVIDMDGPIPAVKREYNCSEHTSLLRDQFAIPQTADPNSPSNNHEIELYKQTLQLIN